ncbi:hypothetical protein B484DRAFT_477841 [Ochromonadaceae sp. CCMP2298]|nr:hypothetical protein B484DRAFT_477841 [Ochromonadaceae sp. CCMP2298]
MDAETDTAEVGRISKKPPSEIRFSQSTVNSEAHTIFDFDLYDMDAPSNYIETVRFSDDSVASFDNKRLYRARRDTEDPLWRMGLVSFNYYDKVSVDRSDRFGITVMYEYLETVECVELSPTTFEAAMAARCCLQSPTFALVGEKENAPEVGKSRPSTHNLRPKVKKKKFDEVDGDEATFWTRLNGAGVAVFCLEKGRTPLVEHVLMKAFLLQHKDEGLFSVDSYMRLWGAQLKAAADVRRDEGGPELDFEERMLHEREKEVLEARDQAYYAEREPPQCRGISVLADLLPRLVECLRVMRPDSYAAAVAVAPPRHGPEIIRVLSEAAKLSGVAVSTCVCSLQAVFEFMPIPLTQQLARLLQEEPRLACAVIECLLACCGRGPEVAPTVLLVLPSPICFRPAEFRRPTAREVFVDVYLCLDRRLFRACTALSKTITFERDMVWQLLDHLMLLPLTASASVDMALVLKGASTAATQNRNTLVDTLRACEQTRALCSTAGSLMLQTLGTQYALLFTFGPQVHQLAVESFERQAGAIGLVVHCEARLRSEMVS